MSRAYTATELKEIFLDNVRQCSKYWGSDAVKERTLQERLDGLAFSILNIIDGTACDYPGSLDLVASAHESDKEYNQERGEKWVPIGTVINNCMLHEEFYKKA